MHADSLAPIFLTSSVTGQGLDLIRLFYNLLPQRHNWWAGQDGRGGPGAVAGVGGEQSAGSLEKQLAFRHLTYLPVGFVGSSCLNLPAHSLIRPPPPAGLRRRRRRPSSSSTRCLACQVGGAPAGPCLCPPRPAQSHGAAQAQLPGAPPPPQALPCAACACQPRPCRCPLALAAPTQAWAPWWRAL